MLLLYSDLTRNTVKPIPFKALKMKNNYAWKEYLLKKLEILVEIGHHCPLASTCYNSWTEVQTKSKISRSSQNAAGKLLQFPGTLL